MTYRNRDSDVEAARRITVHAMSKDMSHFQNPSLTRVAIDAGSLRDHNRTGPEVLLPADFLRRRRYRTDCSGVGPVEHPAQHWFDQRSDFHCLRFTGRHAVAQTPGQAPDGGIEARSVRQLATHTDDFLVAVGLGEKKSAVHDFWRLGQIS